MTTKPAGTHSLIKLVDPCPQTRMGIDQLLVHRYFEVDGVSEFKDIREKGKIIKHHMCVHNNSFVSIISIKQRRR